MPNDGGHLLLKPHEVEELRRMQPATLRFVKSFMGTDEFIDGRRRWCVWIEKDSVSDALEIPEIRERVNRVRAHRLKSKRPATNSLADEAAHFAEIRHKDSDAIFVPSVSSERREYIPSGLVNRDTIVSNLAFSIPGGAPWVFAVLSSKMHMAWSRAVAGGLETRIRYSSSICYNNFPLPDLTQSKRDTISHCAEAVLVAREHHPEKTIAWLYDPDTMPPDLLAAHRALDESVEQCYRAKPFTSDEERLEYLFALYEQMTTAEAGELFAPPAPTKAKAKTKKS